MTILAIDTSNYALGVGLADHKGENIIGEHISNIKKNHSVRVMPAIDALMNECDILPADLTKIVVAHGPGSYTGVRIGVTIAKTLAWSLKIPLVGVSSLEVLAASAGRYFDGYISPLFDARRGQIYTGLYRLEDANITAVRPDQLVMANEWAVSLTEVDEKVLFAGNDLLIHKEKIQSELGERAFFAAATGHNPRPAELALLGSKKAGEDSHTFAPNYIRLAEAEAKWLESQQNK
ncbi:tRNA (adenosine(37)-N6)-threonylcarbamoyltransferase complex dimerization subunit type 1 TsaB [Bacillus sp. T33-2]|uniref:tRNA (adenosine(37)-N6)-threonylcarbamoyltransferase complex dimerization subunit type 1 TsaB n=1 Tax=Bacillus sp. T33-2 TaxID=2054168 RepID=UPI000C78C351|nr:tRNA (adenosine(37)-N6)-threonylcarbamoyltransferase complex dimerization subunit type 1 TsaB [Bacillus sp. T33-2]PLR98652.1 tRNA (adenosine(37)-N6)-threonylcarbamoyltransferase complex dimerization subunit type 1 TsaB [Bacillus sp. T33-2]